MPGNQSVLAWDWRVVLGHNIAKKLHLEATSWRFTDINVHKDYRAWGVVVGTHSG